MGDDEMGFGRLGSDPFCTSGVFQYLLVFKNFSLLKVISNPMPDSLISALPNLE